MTPADSSAQFSAPPIRLAIPQTASAAMTFSFDDISGLTRALKRGEETAFAWLHRQWSGRINRYSFALAAGDEAAASEIAQAVWLRLARHVRQLPDESALWHWIACAARHASIDLRRKGGRYRAVLRRFAERFRPRRADCEDPDTTTIAALDSALSQLEPEQRAMIESRYFESENLETIAKRHSLTVRAVEGRLARLRQRLRELIASEIEK